ncbi:MAG: hypothetical protein HYR60_13050 [Acidobacteria bacterium]|nr:hypothetical protein [Acidobacteriota bacterium]
MNPRILEYLPLVSPIATLVVVMFGLLVNNRHVDVRINDVMKMIQVEGARLEQMIRAEIATLRAELRTEISAVRAELRTEIAGVRGEMAGLRAEFKTDLAALRVDVGKLDQRMERLEGQRLVR